MWHAIKPHAPQEAEHLPTHAGQFQDSITKNQANTSKMTCTERKATQLLQQVCQLFAGHQAG
jgi:hypothetical protein